MSTRSRSHLTTLAGLSFAFCLAAACTTTSTQEPERRSEALFEGFSTDAQELGAPTDGVTLRAIRVEALQDFVRVIFELEGEVLPATRARLLPDGPAIEISIHGVRMDETGNRPLMNEEGEPFGSLVTVDATPVVSYGRKLALDDSLAEYEINLAAPAAFKLHAEGTARVILDIAKAE